MAKEVKTYRFDDFIRLTESGEFDFEKSKAAVKEIVQVAVLLGDHNMLLDLRDTEIVGQRTFKQAMELVRDVLLHGSDLTNRIASLLPDDKKRLKHAGLVEACLRLKDVDYRIFTDYEEAIEWLADTTTLHEET